MTLAIVERDGTNKFSVADQSEKPDVFQLLLLAVGIAESEYLGKRAESEDSGLTVSCLLLRQADIPEEGW